MSQYICKRFYVLSLSVTEDFDPQVQKLVFNSTSEACVDIDIIDDDYTEDDSTFFKESFRVTLRPIDDYTVLIGDTPFARVNIKDNDSKL